jgi:peptide/nickel transport system substrate-binding protein
VHQLRRRTLKLKNKITITFLTITKNHRLNGGFLFIALCVLFFLASARASSAENNLRPQNGDALVSAIISDARTLIPILASDTASAEVCGLLFNGLVKYDKNIQLTGDLAESWEIKDEGLTIIFHLRKNVRWHDGATFTADDVKFTFQKLIDTNIRTPYSGDFLKVKELNAIDPWTVEVKYKEPFSPGLASWGMGIMPKHVLQNIDLNKGVFPHGIPVGTGPYRFKSWTRQEKIELTANPDYFEGPPYISRFIYRIIPDQTTIFLELETKNIDTTSLTPLQFTRQTDNDLFKKYFKKFETAGNGYAYLGYNLENPIFKDKRVRQALNAAVNKEEIIDITLLGKGHTLTGPFLPESWAYNHGVTDVAYDPLKARELLSEAGWNDLNNDGWIEKNGRRFTFTIIVNQGNDQRIKTAEIIQKQLKVVGIDTRIKVLEWSALLSEFVDKGRFDAVLLGWSLSRDPDCYDIWHSSKTKDGEFNFIHYKNPTVDMFLDEARRTFDLDKRKKCYQKIHALIFEDQPVMFLYCANNLDIVSARFRGIEPAPIGIGYNLIKWWVPKSEQRYKNYMEQ